MSDDPIRLVDGRAVLHIIGNAFDDSADFKSADYVRIRRQIEALPTAGRWIPCSERMPENRNTVLVCLEFEIIGLGSYIVFDDGPCWCFDDGNFSGESLDAVKAWMPLPEPYKEDNNDTD